MQRNALQIIRDDHIAVAAMLRSMRQLIARGPENAPERFFDVLRAMLFYIDEFPERVHHPKESDLLFPRLVRKAPELMPVVRRLEADHMEGEGKVRALQHLLLAWELLGDSRREAFVQSADAYVEFYLDHMRTEEQQLLPVAAKVLDAADYAELDPAFRAEPLPVAGDGQAGFDRLFTRIVLQTPAPIGVG